MISIVGFLDSIAAAKQNGARFGYAISPNRELVALGFANLIGSFIPGTLPAYGSITRYEHLYIYIDGVIDSASDLESTAMSVDARRWLPLFVLVLSSLLSSSSCHGFTSFRSVSWHRCAFVQL